MAPRSMEANDKIKDERRSQIMLTALKIFTRKGFSASKMSDIAGETGISYGLVYHYFKSKDEIYKELIEYAVDSIGRAIGEISNENDEPAEQIRKIICRVLNSVANKEASGYYYILVMNALTCEATPAAAGKIIEKAMNSLKTFSRIVADGQKKGQIRAGDPMEIAVTLFATAIGIASLKVSGSIRNIPSPEILMRIL